METLGDLVARDRRSDTIAVRTDPTGRAMSYHDFCTTAWKAGNFLRYLGVRTDDRVVVAPDPRPEPVLALFGAALLGATTRFGVDTAPGLDGDEQDGRQTSERASTPRVVITHADREHETHVLDGTRLLVYGDVPDDSRSAHWEGDVWSENPAFPPTTVDPTASVLETTTESFTHQELLDATERVIEQCQLGSETTVAIRDSLDRPGVVVAGLLAPLSVGATAVFPDESTSCDLAIGPGPEPTVIEPATAVPER